jgi:hypothetical protein
VRWNARIETDDTPPLLEGLARDPEQVEARVKAVADANGCTYELWWDKFAWAAWISVEGRPQSAQKVLQILEATEVRQELKTDEKKRHPEFK